MSFFTADVIKSLVTEDMINSLISDVKIDEIFKSLVTDDMILSLIKKIFTDERVKSHVKKLVKEVVLDMCEKGQLAKDKINGRGT